MAASPLARSVHPAGRDDLRAAAEEHHVSADTVARVLADAGLYAVPLELVLGDDEPEQPEEPATGDRRLPAIQFGEGSDGGTVCRLR